MITVQGMGVCQGIAFGKLRFYRKDNQPVAQQPTEDVDAELHRFEEAKKAVVRRLEKLYQKALGDVGEENALLFQVHQMMLEDEDYCGAIADMIRLQKVNAEHAVAAVGDYFSQIFSEMDNAYMRERFADVKDVSDQLIAALQGRDTTWTRSGESVIVAAADLTPSETMQMDKRHVLAFVTAKGSANSHTAILARALGIPAVIAAKQILQPAFDGAMAIVDGFTGTVYVNPDPDTIAHMKKKQEHKAEEQAKLERLKGMPDVTPDGREVLLYANIGGLSDLEAALQNDCRGIGLFRTEFLYLESKSYPTEDHQFAVYKKVAEAMAGKRVIFRTLDIGADKQADYFSLPREENPALGMRAVRVCLSRPEVFRTQLRALYRASAFGTVAIMIPMVTSLWEIRRVKEMMESAKQELGAEKIPFAADVEIGIMIETPAAAMISDLLAREVDFFSIGTNDLTQYTLAVDRQSHGVSQFWDPKHEALLRLIRLTVQNAHQGGIWVGICGELAADPSMTRAFLEMGVDELSVAPAAILPLRAAIRGI